VASLRVLTVAFPEQEHLWTVALAVLACASLAIGNLAALVQQNVKRLLAYSSVSHAGFMLIAIAAANELGGRALLYYLIPYSAMSLGAFAVVAARERELGRAVTLDDLAGMGWERPFLGVAMWTFMLGFAGFPLTGGFVGKLYVFAAAYEAGWWWLIVAGAAATAVSLYYYLGVVRALYMRPGAEGEWRAVIEDEDHTLRRAIERFDETTGSNLMQQAEALALRRDWSPKEAANATYITSIIARMVRTVARGVAKTSVMVRPLIPASAAAQRRIAAQPAGEAADIFEESLREEQR